MTPLDLARMFLDKGKEDEDLVRVLVEQPAISDDIFGFHVQQALEKYLKAILAIGQVRPTRTHVLPVLLDEVETLGLRPTVTAAELEPWSAYAVRNRYPLPERKVEVARSDALDLVRSLRSWAQNVVAQASS